MKNRFANIIYIACLLIALFWARLIPQDSEKMAVALMAFVWFFGGYAVRYILTGKIYLNPFK